MPKPPLSPVKPPSTKQGAQKETTPKKSKGKQPKLPPPPPPKKLGRPTNEEVLQRKVEKLQQEEKEKEVLIATNAVNYPLLHVNTRVEILLASNEYRRGTVTRQDVGSQFAHVVWDDGGRDWRDSRCLQLVTDKRYLRVPPRVKVVVSLDD